MGVPRGPGKSAGSSWAFLGQAELPQDPGARRRGRVREQRLQESQGASTSTCCACGAPGSAQSSSLGPNTKGLESQAGEFKLSQQYLTFWFYTTEHYSQSLQYSSDSESERLEHRGGALSQESLAPATGTCACSVTGPGAEAPFCGKHVFCPRGYACLPWSDCHPCAERALGCLLVHQVDLTVNYTRE